MQHLHGCEGAHQDGPERVLVWQAALAIAQLPRLVLVAGATGRALAEGQAAGQGHLQGRVGRRVRAARLTVSPEPPGRSGRWHWCKRVGESWEVARPRSTPRLPGWRQLKALSMQNGPQQRARFHAPQLPCCRQQPRLRTWLRRACAQAGATTVWFGCGTSHSRPARCSRRCHCWTPDCAHHSRACTSAAYWSIAASCLAMPASTAAGEPAWEGPERRGSGRPR